MDPDNESPEMLCDALHCPGGGGFLAYGVPRIDSVKPDGEERVGDVLEVYGINFTPKAVGKFDDTWVAATEYVSMTKLLVTVPEVDPGTYALTEACTGGVSAGVNVVVGV